MDGLECSEISKNDLERTLRIDSEFYQKENLNVEKLLQKTEYFPLTKFTSVSDGNHMAISDRFITVGIPYYRGQDVKSFFIEDSQPICIDEESFGSSYMMRSHLQKGDVLLSIVGTIGKLSLVNSNRKATCSCKLAILRPQKGVSGEVIATFLTSKYGQNQIKKYTRGAVQMGLILEDMDQLLVPNFSNEFITKITELFTDMNQAKTNSILVYDEANRLLLDLLSIETQFEDNGIISTSKLLSESFKVSGRLDAEYYQPKYEQIENQIASNNTVYNSCKIYDKNFNPNDDIIYQYIELVNVDLMGGIATPSSIIGKELPSRARRLVKTGQIIISSIEGSLQSCALITEQFNNAICSTGFFVLDSEKYNPETLLVLFKSEPIQELLKKRCSGTILTAISKDELEKMPLPELDKGIQEQIAEKVQESFRLRKKSKKLLAIAVKAVEMAIETDEETAITWLREQGV